MSVLVTREAPDFKAQAVMANGSFEELSLSSFRGKYVLLFFYPLDFTFVCPSEILAFDKALSIHILPIWPGRIPRSRKAGSVISVFL